MRIAFLGTRGVPAAYGGFETAVEEIGARLVERGHRVLVYRRSRGPEDTSPLWHRGMRLVTLPSARTQSLDTLSHTGISAIHTVVRSRPDACVVMNSANAPYVTLLRTARIPVVAHIDGHEWLRPKWSGARATYSRRAEALAVRSANAVIADSPVIAEYLWREYAIRAHEIAYGAPIVSLENSLIVQRFQGSQSTRSLEPGGYHLVVARWEPENHVADIVSGHAHSESTLPLVVVGAAAYGSEYGREVREAAGGSTLLIGSVWDQELLDALYAGAASYIHGHSVGGTNPSLLRALGAGAPVSSYDCSFNRATYADARFWRTADEAGACMVADEKDAAGAVLRGVRGQTRARDFDWDDVTTEYEKLLQEVRHRG